LPPIWAVPIRHPLILGTKAEKTFRIQSVRNLIIVFPVNREPEPNDPLYYVKMLQFLEDCSWLVVRSSWFLVLIPCLPPTAYCLLLCASCLKSHASSLFLFQARHCPLQDWSNVLLDGMVGVALAQIVEHRRGLGRLVQAVEQ
jgi:hypothetical protein